MKEESEKSWLKIQHSESGDCGIQSHYFMANRWGNNIMSEKLNFWPLKSMQMVSASIKLKDAYFLEEKL